MGSKINVFLVGAQKAGTTSLYEWLGQHPGVCAPQEIKDYHFFANEDIYTKGIPHLEGFYKACQGVTVHGAVNYLYFYEKSARRIYDYNPDAKIIICLREPVARAISAYMYCVKTLRETKSFTEALGAEIGGQLLTFKQRADNTYIDHGRYVEQIKEFKRHFSDRQVKIVLFEDLVNKSKRQAVIVELLDFIGVSSDFEFDFTHLNNSGAPRSNVINRLIRGGWLNKFIKPFLPVYLRKKIGRKMNELNTSSGKINVDIKDKDIEILQSHLGKIKDDLYSEYGIDVSDSWA